MKMKFIDESKDKTIGDEIALAIGNIGENLSLRRAVVFNSVPNQFISWYIHGSSKIKLISIIIKAYP